MYLNRIFQELERNAQDKCVNEEVVDQTSEQTKSCDDPKEHSNRVPRSFSGK